MPVFDYKLRVQADVTQAEAAIRRLRELESQIGSGPSRLGQATFGANVPGQSLPQQFRYTDAGNQARLAGELARRQEQVRRRVENDQRVALARIPESENLWKGMSFIGPQDYINRIRNVRTLFDTVDKRFEALQQLTRGFQTILPTLPGGQQRAKATEFRNELTKYGINTGRGPYSVDTLDPERRRVLALRDQTAASFRQYFGTGVYSDATRPRLGLEEIAQEQEKEKARLRRQVTTPDADRRNEISISRAKQEQERENRERSEREAQLQRDQEIIAARSRKQANTAYDNPTPVAQLSPERRQQLWAEVDRNADEIRGLRRGSSGSRLEGGSGSGSGGRPPPLYPPPGPSGYFEDDDVARQSIREVLRRRASTQSQLLSNELLSTDAVIREETELALSIRRRRARLDQAQLAATTDPDRQLQAANAVERARQAAQVQLARGAAIEGGAGGEEGYYSALGEAAASKKREAAETNAAMERSLAEDTSYIEAKSEAARAHRLGAERIKAAELGITTNFGAGEEGEAQRRAAIAVAQRANQEREKIGYNNRLLGEMRRDVATESEIVQLEIQRAASDRELRGAQNNIRRAAIQQGIAEGSISPGTLFQRFQASIRSRGPQGVVQTPEEQATLGQFVAQKAATTVGFAVSGFALFGVIGGVRELLKYSEDLQRTFATIRAQFDSLGEGAGFERFRSGILAIARDTGTTASQVATVGFQLKGAFGDTPRALQETSSAIKLAAVSGLELSEVTDSLTATALTFNTSISDIGDNALGLQERFGVLARETIKFTADLAPVAQEAGFTERQLAALGAVAQQVSGRSGGALAEQFGRVIPGLQSKATDLLSVYSQTPALQPHVANLEDALAAGNSQKIIALLLEDYPKLSRAQRNYVNELLGGRREAGAVITVLENGRRVLNEWGRSSQEDAGKTSRYFKELHDTVSNTMARLREVFKQVGESLFRSGIGTALADIGSALAAIIGQIGSFLGIIGSINSATHGWALRIAELYAAYKITTLAINAFTRAQEESSAAGILSGGGGGLLGGVGSGAAKLLSRSKAALTAEETLAAANAGFEVAPVAAAATARQGLLATARGGVGAFTGAARGAATAFGAGEFGAAAGLVAPYAIPLLIGGSIAYNQLKSSAQAHAEQVASKFEKETDTQIQQAVKTGEGIRQRIYRALFHTPTDQDLARNAQTQREGQGYADQLRAIRDARVEIGTPRRSSREGLFTGERVQSAVERGGRLDITSPRDIAENAIGGGAPRIIRELFHHDDDIVRRFENHRVNLDELADAAASGDKKAVEAAKKLLDYYKKHPDKAKGDIQAALASLKDAQGEGPVSATLKTLDEQRQLFQAGAISGTEYGASLQQSIQSLSRLREKGDADKTRALELAKLQKEWSEFQAQAAAETFEDINEFLTTTGAGSEEKLRAVIAALRDPRIATNPAKRREFLQKADQAMQAVIQHRVDLAQSETQKLLAQGSPVEKDQTVRGETISQQFDQTGPAGDALANAAKGLGISFQDLRERTMGLAQGDKNAYAELKKQLQSRLAFYQDVLQYTDVHDRGPVQAQIDRLNQSIAGIDAALSAGSLSDPKYYTAMDKDQISKALSENQFALDQQRLARSPLNANADRLRRARADIGRADAAVAEAASKSKDDQLAAQAAHLAAEKELLAAQQEGDQLALQLIQSQIDLWASQTSHRNPLDQAAAALRKANADLKDATAANDPTRINAALKEQNDAAEQSHQAIADQGRAGNERQQQFYGRNRPVKAQYAIQSADQAIAEARRVHDTAAEIRALTQRQQAVDDFWQSISDIMDAQTSLAVAMADAAGDHIGATRISLDNARRHLALVQSQYAEGRVDVGVLANAQTEVVQAEAASRDAQLQQDEKDIDFALQMHQISKATAVARLRNILAEADVRHLTTDERQEIQLKIRGLLDDLKQDYQFNLPTFLGLPTLYEARRLNQTPGGGGYQDNRQVSIQVYVNNGTDLQTMKNVLADAVGVNRTGVELKRY